MKGFTLIELLATVMIIGILASVALPQYTKVIEKSRATEAMINAKAITDAIQRHLQEYPGETVMNFSQIADVKIAGQNLYSNVHAGKHFRYVISNNGVEVQRVEPDSQGKITLQNPTIYAVTYTYNPATSTVSAAAGTGCTDSKYQSVCNFLTSLYNTQN